MFYDELTGIEISSCYKKWYGEILKNVRYTTKNSKNTMESSYNRIMAKFKIRLQAKGSLSSAQNGATPSLWNGEYEHKVDLQAIPTGIIRLSGSLTWSNPSTDTEPYEAAIRVHVWLSRTQTPCFRLDESDREVSREAQCSLSSERIVALLSINLIFCPCCESQTAKVDFWCDRCWWWLLLETPHEYRFSR